MRQVEHPENAGKSSRKRHQNDERIQPTLEVNGHQKIDDDDGKSNAELQSVERLFHCGDFTAQIEERSRRQLLFLFDDGVNLIGNSTQIALVGVRIDVEGRLNIVVIDHDRRDISLQRREIRQQLTIRSVRRRNRRSLQCFERVDPVLGRLRHDLVIDSVLRIQPLIWSRLAAAG